MDSPNMRPRSAARSAISLTNGIELKTSAQQTPDSTEAIEVTSPTALLPTSQSILTIHTTASETTTTQQPQIKSTTSQALLMLLKAFIGSGILFLPGAFKNGGMALSIVCTFAIGYVSLQAMFILIDVKQHFHVIRENNEETHLFSVDNPNEKNTFAGIGRIAVLHRWPQHKRWLPKTIVIAVETALAASQFGFCAATFVFFAENIRKVAKVISKDQVRIPVSALIFGQLVFYIPCSRLRHISKLSPLAIVADFIILLGIITVLSYDFTELGRNGVASPIIYFNTEEFPLFLGTIIYAFEGIGLIMPIHTAMEKPAEFKRILSYTVFLVGLIMLLLAIPSYLAFGPRITIIIFAAFPQNHHLVQNIQILYSFAMMFTVPMTMFPGTMIIEKYVLGWKPGNKMREAIRIVTPILVALFAWSLGEQLGILVSVVGSLCCGPLLFIFPAIFHYTIAGSRFTKGLDIALGIFGVFITVVVTLITISNL